MRNILLLLCVVAVSPFCRAQDASYASLEALAKREADACDYLVWAKANQQGWSGVVDGRTVTYTPAQVVEMARKARQDLEVVIPMARRKLIAARLNGERVVAVAMVSGVPTPQPAPVVLPPSTVQLAGFDAPAGRSATAPGAIPPPVAAVPRMTADQICSILDTMGYGGSKVLAKQIRTRTGGDADAVMAEIRALPPAPAKVSVPVLVIR